jgi:hypothetical protein
VKLSAYIAMGSPLIDSFTRFNFFALALRPLLKEALTDPHQNLKSFLPRAADAWLVLAEPDRARKPQLPPLTQRLQIQVDGLSPSRWCELTSL